MCARHHEKVNINAVCLYLCLASHVLMTNTKTIKGRGAFALQKYNFKDIQLFDTLLLHACILTKNIITLTKTLLLFQTHIS